jgi:hypothetical protein
MIPPVLRKALLLGLVASRASAESVPAREPELPTGSAVIVGERPAATQSAFCSPKRPVCAQGSDGAAALRALAALEDAYEKLVFGLGLPPPRADEGRGGTDALDAYVTAPGTPFAADSDAPAHGLFSSTSAFCRLPLDEPPLLLRSAVLCVGEAIAVGLDASEAPFTRRAFATSLWWLVGTPTVLDLEAIDAVQRTPELAIGAGDVDTRSEGAALFFSYLEQALGAGEPGELSASLLSAAASPYPRGPSYDNEPDTFDVLRHTVDGRFAFARLMSDFAVSRAFLGDREDGQHLPLLAWAGSFGRARFDWVIPFSSLPRRVSIHPAIDSTGSVLVWLDLDKVPERAALGFQAEWEAPVSFHWQLVRVGEHGEELGRIPVVFEDRSTLVEATVGHLAGTRAVLAVGTNLETVALDHPFDPDVRPFEPHGLTVYFAAL